MRILHPHPELGAQKFIGVLFRDGVAVVDELHPETVAALIQHGFTIEAETPPKPSKRTSKGKAVKAEKTADDTAGPYAIAELADGSIIGDGESLATLPTVED